MKIFMHVDDTTLLHLALKDCSQVSMVVRLYALSDLIMALHHFIHV